MPQASNESPAKVGICVLNYHHAEETAACIESLLAKEPATTRILWIENDAGLTRPQAMSTLEKASFRWVVLEAGAETLPPAGTVGVIFNEENLGYGGGNNVGLRLLHRAGVPFAWVLNNDTQLLEGSSDLLVAAAESRPEVGAWGTLIQSEYALPFGVAQIHYFGGIVSQKSFGTSRAQTIEGLENDPQAYVSGCSLFARTSVFSEVGFIPEDYFLYYEDPAFTYELRKRGYTASGVASVRVHHAESLSTGRRSAFTEYYARRNRWLFIERYHPEALPSQKKKFWYTLQKYLFRLRFSRIREEWIAYKDYRDRKMGRSSRTFSRMART